MFTACMLALPKWRERSLTQTSSSSMPTVSRFAPSDYKFPTSNDNLPKHLHNGPIMSSSPNPSLTPSTSFTPASSSPLINPIVFARRVATLCFCTDTIFQALSLLSDAEISRSSPSSLYAAYSPHPYAQLGFFVVGVMTQLLWLLKLYPVAVTGDDYEFIGLGLRRSGSGCPSRNWGHSKRGTREEGSDGEGATLLFSADEEAQSDADEGQSGRGESNSDPDSRPRTPDDEREERDGQVLPMRPMSPKSSSRLAFLPKSDAIPVIEVMSASDDDARSEKSERSVTNVKSDVTVDNEEVQQDVTSEKFVVMSERLQMRYLPHYFVSTSCQVAWTCSWTMRHYDLCIIFVFINLFSQIYALFVTLDGSRNHRFPTANIYTHFTAKLRIAIAILCLWKTWGAVDVVPPPTVFEGAVNCTFFMLLSGASGPDPTMGILLALILLSLGMGRHTNIEWHLMFNWSSVIVFLFVVIDLAGGIQIRQLLWPRARNSDLEDDL
ncbi:hypothetical protein D9619_003758 [Psilocybe cf. subviscida]|uniref:Transmembrane protein n=1 Tax=Psilocybe cf. subviscida TaxID=2480587 RepID=A0A8H5EU10_9AGAR|nr:hypothetical protein D9619_003758 [Psilocybe cf. subviscida]